MLQPQFSKLNIILFGMHFQLIDFFGRVEGYDETQRWIRLFVFTFSSDMFELGTILDFQGGAESGAESA